MFVRTLKVQSSFVVNAIFDVGTYSCFTIGFSHLNAIVFKCENVSGVV